MGNSEDKINVEEESMTINFTYVKVLRYLFYLFKKQNLFLGGFGFYFLNNYVFFSVLAYFIKRTVSSFTFEITWHNIYFIMTSWEAHLNVTSSNSNNVHKSHKLFYHL